MKEKTYNQISDLRYKVQNPILKEQANRYGIITAVRDLRMTLFSGLMKDVLFWKNILMGTEDGKIVREVWQWIFGTDPTFVTQYNRNTGAIINAWVAEI